MGKSVAILMSTYNGEKYLDEQIQSLLRQTYDNVTIYARDDGSNDATVAILKKYESESFIIFEDENIGVVGSFFELLKKCGLHDYYAFCDQDDVWQKEKIEKQIRAFNENQIISENDIAICCTGLEIVDEQLKNIGMYPVWRKKPAFANAMVQNIASGLTLVMTRQTRNTIIDRLPKYDQVCMHDWWLYLVSTALGRVMYLPEPWVKYRQHAQNVWGANASGIGRWQRRFLKFFDNNEQGKVTLQLQEFRIRYQDLLKDYEKALLEEYLTSNKHFSTRLMYVLKKNVYRQTFIETLAFKVLYLLNAY